MAPARRERVTVPTVDGSMLKEYWRTMLKLTSPAMVVQVAYSDSPFLTRTVVRASSSLLEQWSI